MLGSAKASKLIEESGANVLDESERDATLVAAVHAAREIGYVGAGTMEFLLDAEGTLRFMEMNARLQVEHSVSEMRTGFDLVETQIRVAAGERLWFSQDDIVLRGHAIECRINAEDPSHDFTPSPGVIELWQTPEEGADLRIDTHIQTGYEMPPFYDSLLCKVIAWGEDRNRACDRLVDALRNIRCEGICTTIPMHLSVLQSRAFRDDDYDSGAIPGWEF